MQTTPRPVPTSLPRKSRRRWYVLGFLLLLLLAVPVSYYFLAGWWGNREIEEICRELDQDDPRWRWPDLIAQLKPPPDEKNAAAQIVKVHALLKKTPFMPGPKWDNAPKDPLMYRNARLTDEQAKLLGTAFNALGPEVMVEARKLKDMPEGRFAIDAEKRPFELPLDDVQKTRAVFNLLQLDAVVRAQDGDMQGAAESCQALVNATHAINDFPQRSVQLIRTSGQAIAAGAIERMLGQRTVSEAKLRDLQALLEAEAADNPLYHGLRGDRAGAHQTYELMREGKLSFSVLLGDKPGNPSMTGRFFDALPNVVLNGYPEFFRLLNEEVHASKLKDVAQQEAIQKVEQKASESRNVLTSLLIPPGYAAKLAMASQRSQAQMRCAIAALAAERYRLQHGAWPRLLDDLVKDGLLKEIPKDPYDGQPLRWRRTATGVIVYCVGPDKIDNGGKFDRDDPTAADTDVGFELWDTTRARGVPAPATEEKPIGGAR
jgi:hypothetical protein